MSRVYRLASGRISGRRMPRGELAGEDDRGVASAEIVDRNAHARAARPAVAEPLQVIAPAAVLVDLVEDPQRPCGQFALEDPLPLRCDVPVEVRGARDGKPVDVQDTFIDRLRAQLSERVPRCSA
jgi:hypothetical protein